MKTITSLSFFILFTIYCQVPEPIKYHFSFIKNAENLSGSSDEVEGLIMKFDFYNKDKKIGNGGGWLIYKEGTKAADSLAKNLYPVEKLKGFVFIKDLFHLKDRSPKVDSVMLKEFDIYLYIIDPKYLELKLNTDGEGAGKTYSYYEKYPLDIAIYKQEAGKDYFVQCKIYHAANEDEHMEALKSISEFKKNTAISSNKD